MTNEEKIEKIIDHLEKRMNQVLDHLSEEDLEDPKIKEKFDEFLSIIEKYCMGLDLGEDDQ